MARTPGEMESSAKTKNSMAPHPDTEDLNVTRSGSAVSMPKVPRFDSEATFVADLRDDRDLTGEAVPQTQPQSTGGVRAKTSGRTYTSK